MRVRILFEKLRFWALATAVWATVAAAGCIPDTEIPPAALLSCGEGDACPENYVCRPALGRCVPSDVDPTPPAVSNVDWSADRVRHGDTVSVAFDASQPILDPRVYMETSERRIEFVLDEARTDREALRWVFGHVVDGDEPEETLSVRADLVDTNGNQARDVRLGAVAFDFTPPGIVPGTETLQLIAGADNVLQHVEAVTVGTTVRMGFNVTEPLGADPVVTISADGASPFEKVHGIGLTYLYAFTLESADVAQGPHAVEVTLVDTVGNEATVAVALPEPGLEMDTVAPAPPDVVAPGRILYTRMPWGTAQTGGDAAMWLAGEEGAVDDAGTLLVYSAETSPRAELGRGPIGEDGSFDFALTPSDRAVVYVAAADRAGNLSDAVAVRDVEWVATMGGKIAGSSLENPHRFEGRSWQGAAVVDHPAAEVGADSGIDLPGGGALSVRGGARWMDAHDTERPPIRSGHAMAYDATRGRIVLFGGTQGGSMYLDDTFEWHGASWRLVVPAGGVAPGPRSGHAMAYDAARGRTVLFGGEIDAPWPWDDETWEWDGASWRRMAPEGDLAPSTRHGHAMAYDDARGRVVLFGGNIGGDETWEWDGRSWQSWSPEDGDVAPDARRGHAMAYDATRERVVLFGGLGSTDVLDDTWEWDGTRWQLMAPADGVAPSARRNHAMAYDADRGQVVLFGGFDVSRLDDTWAWDGQAWERTEPADGVAPTDRSGHALAHDAARGQLVLFGGSADDGRSDETWRWDGTRWRDVPTAVDDRPGARHLHAMVLDAARERVVLFGGRLGVVLDDTWEWDGSSWEMRSPAGGIAPSGRSGHALAQDAGGSGILLFGGWDDEALSDETWTWNGAAWDLRAPTDGIAPSPRSGHAMVYEATRDRVILFGGSAADGDSDETWAWDGAAWQRLTPTGDVAPSARRRHAMAYDAARDRVVLFGGSDGNLSDETWEWDGVAWERITPQGGIAPPERWYHAMVYDAARQRVLLFGGCTSPSNCPGSSDVWAWDGASWVPSEAAGEAAPSGRFGHAMAFDAANEQVVVFGGCVTLCDFDGIRDETWILDTDARPAGYFELDTRSAFIPPGATLTAFSAEAIAGGSGRIPEDPVSGVGLWAWQAGRWLPMAASGAGLESPEAFGFTETAPTILERLLHRHLVHVAVMPAGTGGAGPPAEVAIDYVEARLRYRRP